MISNSELKACIDRAGFLWLRNIKIKPIKIGQYNGIKVVVFENKKAKRIADLDYIKKNSSKKWMN